MNRRIFIANGAKAGIAFSLFGTYACKQIEKEKKENSSEELPIETEVTPFFKLSLAQWSINKMIREEGVDPYTFAEKAKSWGFAGLEYVSQLYIPEFR